MKKKSMKVKRVAKSGLPKLSRKRKASTEPEVESSDEDELPVLDEPEVEEKPTTIEVPANSDSDDEGDSDKELQIALRDGLLKTDRLNYLVQTKRPIINKTAEMREKIAEFAKKLPWIETVDVTTKSTLTKDMIDNDFEREMQFYQQAEKAVQLAVPRLLSMGIKVIRPSDYYAEMAKSDGHMQKVRKRLLKIQEGKERQEAIRRMREEKKYAAKVQKDVLDKRNSEKKQLMEAVKKHKKGMKQQLEDMLNNVKRMGLDQDDEAAPSGSSKQRPVNKFGHSKPGRGFDAKKQWKSQKFGYGGKKKGSKRNDKESFESISDGKGKFGGGGFGGKSFHGKVRRGGARSRGRRR
ncbi:eukaryotic rRNA processing protein EBP2 [Oesophagostomum dentatum]|uniref:Eukaryotic rRNA processing protein EBP2 n=1 Tax=Oesophagostomum dentatum TaxID=61180 RepID=A0A0B1SW60_OESDE|nr:eukaryotic rRNA processing protein EBP2 [Oesophagostomum dentatum]